MKIFVSKIYTVAQYGFKRLDEEKAFYNYADALTFLKEEFFDDDDDKSYFAEIVSYRINDNEKITIQKIKYNGLGIIIKEENENDIFKNKHQQHINKQFLPKYKKGDLVTIKFVQGISYSLFKDTIGVVTYVPLSYQEWKEKYNLPDTSWDPVYTVEFIGETGFLTHSHPIEQEIELFNNTLSNELTILEKISNHFKGVKLIKEDVLKAFRHREIYMLNTKTINDINWD